jgi:hypothetical protein
MDFGIYCIVYSAAQKKIETNISLSRLKQFVLLSAAFKCSDLMLSVVMYKKVKNSRNHPVTQSD